jgi:5'-3' exonuclease
VRWAVDGDIILYSCCFAAKDDTLEAACSSTRSMAESVMYAVDAEGIDIYLTGSDNYRKEIADDYKANRAGDEKPPHFYEVRKYMIEELGCIVVDGQEADDALGIAACQLGHGIATIDKDLDGVPGDHYNWRKESRYMVSELEANRFFYKQLATGDSTDNIPGLFRRVGVKATKKLLDPIDEMEDTREMYEHIRSLYLNGYEKVGMCLDEKEEVVDNWLLKQARCLWIRRDYNEMWSVPDGTENTKN